jgi:nitric oxide reductase subunit B
MRYQTQRVAYAYWAVALLLYGLQMVFGLLAAAKYLGPDPLRDILPFDRVKAVHTNLLIVWVLTGPSCTRPGSPTGASRSGPSRV